MRVWNLEERWEVLRLVPKDHIKTLPVSYISYICDYMRLPDLKGRKFTVADLLCINPSELLNEYQATPVRKSEQIIRSRLTERYWRTREVLETLGFTKEDGVFMHSDDEAKSLRMLQAELSLSEEQARKVREYISRKK